MWTLVFVTLMTGVSSGGGVDTAITTIQFQSQQSCNAAAAVLTTGTPDPSIMAPAGFPNTLLYRFVAKCVQN